VYEVMLERDMPLLVHAGRGPTDNGLVGVERFARAMRRFPGLRVCVAHLGAPESREFVALLDDYPQLFLDTSGIGNRSLRGLGLERHTDRIVFGTDAPNIAFPYDNAIERVLELGLDGQANERVFRDNAIEFLKL
jgi:predicted TIM-barrel fold metal-dependent hydrolase